MDQDVVLVKDRFEFLRQSILFLYKTSDVCYLGVASDIFEVKGLNTIIGAKLYHRNNYQDTLMLEL